jgi:hypothetical protein
MSRSAIKLKRLQSISEEAWEKMSEEERLTKEDLLKNFQKSAEQWRLGPYGYLWEGVKIKRPPTKKELMKFKERAATKLSESDGPKR